MAGSRGPVGSADDLRRRFDASFAAPPPAPAGELAALLAIRVGGDPYALRIAEIGGLSEARKIVRVPGARAGVLGLAAHRGVVVPVFDLAAAIGYERGGGAPRWLALSPGTAPVAFAFEEFEGYFELPLAQLRPAADPQIRSSHVREVLRDRGVVRGVVSLAALIGAAGVVNDETARALPAKER
jgi:chemotaxis signal transduction protein